VGGLFKCRLVVNNWLTGEQISSNLNKKTSVWFTMPWYTCSVPRAVLMNGTRGLRRSWTGGVLVGGDIGTAGREAQVTSPCWHALSIPRHCGPPNVIALLCYCRTQLRAGGQCIQAGRGPGTCSGGHGSPEATGGLQCSGHGCRCAVAQVPL
jgi:hypothetical protein